MTVDGWIPVDPLTLETPFPGVYAVGDVTSVGTPKAGVFAEGQAAVVADAHHRPAPRRRDADRATTAAASATSSSATTRSPRSTSPSSAAQRPDRRPRGPVGRARRRQGRVRHQPDPALVRPRVGARARDLTFQPAPDPAFWGRIGAPGAQIRPRKSLGVTACGHGWGCGARAPRRHRPGRAGAHRREVTPVELVEAAIERIEALNPTLNAVVTPIFDRALDAAAPARAHRPVRRGAVSCSRTSPCEMRGRARSPRARASWRDNVSDLRPGARGAAARGRAWSSSARPTRPSSAWRRPASRALFGPTRNPWDLDRSTSGSSGGSAAAVASGHGAVGARQRPRRLASATRRRRAGCSASSRPGRATRSGPSTATSCGGWRGRARADPLGPRQRRAARRDVAGPALGDPVLGAAAGAPVRATRSGPTPAGCASRYTARTARRRPRPPRLRRRRSTTRSRLCASLGHEVVEADLPGLDARGRARPSARCSTPPRRGSSRYWIRRARPRARAPTRSNR